MDVFTVVIASVLLLSVGACCPPHWHANGTSCYYVSLTQKATWPEAVTYCRVLGGYLVDIENAAEDQFVRDLAKLTSAHIVWVGATDMQQEDQWMSSHTQKPLEYTGTWASGEPNHVGNCMCLWPDSGYNWADKYCHFRDKFICERPAAELP